MMKCAASYSQRRLKKHYYPFMQQFYPFFIYLLTRWYALVLKVGVLYGCRTGAKAFKRRLVHSTALTIITLYVQLLNSVFASVLKCVYATLSPLMMSPFACDSLQMQVDY